ncbi:MAG: hypothetical protein AAF497_07035, partial [Planctomycetota bacterium]
MRRIARDAQDDQNYDSFLDIVANLVGILVILIMVIGVRAREASLAHAAVEPTEATPLPVVMIETPEPTEPTVPLELHRQAASQIEGLNDQLQTAKSKNTGANQEVAEMDQRIKDIDQRAMVEKEERNRLQLLVSMAEKSLEDRRTKLSEVQQTELDLARKIDKSRVELASLNEKLSAIETNTGEAQVIQHHPTPIAKTVFGAEEHLRLMNGKVAYVP